MDWFSHNGPGPRGQGSVRVATGKIHMSLVSEKSLSSHLPNSEMSYQLPEIMAVKAPRKVESAMYVEGVV